jgi:hypothetical protein
VQPSSPRPASAPEEKPPEGAPGWGWTVAILVWVLCFGFMCLYELWTGVVTGLMRR